MRIGTFNHIKCFNQCVERLLLLAGRRIELNYEQHYRLQTSLTFITETVEINANLPWIRADRFGSTPISRKMQGSYFRQYMRQI